MDRRNDRLGAILDVPQARVNDAGTFDGSGACGDGFEKADVRARDKGASGADQNSRPDAGVFRGSRHESFNGFGDAWAESVHRRVIDGDDGNVVAYFVTDEIRHWVLGHLTTEAKSCD